MEDGMTQPVDITNNEEAKQDGWEIQFGDADASNGEGWVLVQKGWLIDGDSKTLKTTKRMVVPGAWLYQTETTIYIGINREDDEGATVVKALDGGVAEYPDPNAGKFYVRVVSTSQALAVVPFPSIQTMQVGPDGMIVPGPGGGS